MRAFYEVARLADVPTGAGRSFCVDGVAVALFNLNGAIHALADACALNGTPLATGKVRGHVVTCAEHGLQYDVTSGQLIGGPSLRVERYSVRVVDDRILVALDPRPWQARARVRAHRPRRPPSSTPSSPPRRR